MKVKDLIDNLKKFHPESSVFLESDFGTKMVLEFYFSNDTIINQDTDQINWLEMSDLKENKRPINAVLISF